MCTKKIKMSPEPFLGSLDLSELDSPATGPAVKRDNMIRSNGLHNLIKNHPIYFLCPLPCSMSS